MKRSLIDISKQLWRTINTTQEVLLMDDHDCSQAMRMSIQSFRYYRKTERALPFTSFCYLADKLNLSLDSLIYSTFDLDTLVDHHLKQNPLTIREDYVAGVSKIPKHSLINLFNFQECSLKNETLKHLQITDEALKNPNVNFSLQVLNDAIAYLKRYRHSLPFKKIGAINMQAYQINEQPKKSPTKIFTDFLEETQKDNWIFKLQKVDSKKILFRSYPKKDIIEQFKTPVYSVPEICEMKIGLGSHLPIKYGYTPALITETACVHHNFKYCELEIDLYSIKQRPTFHSV